MASWYNNWASKLYLLLELGVFLSSDNLHVPRIFKSCTEKNLACPKICVCIWEAFFLSDRGELAVFWVIDSLINAFIQTFGVVEDGITMALCSLSRFACAGGLFHSWTPWVIDSVSCETTGKNKIHHWIPGQMKPAWSACWYAVDIGPVPAWE